MKENYDRALRFLFFWERHISNHPRDPGRLTIWGICERYWPKEVEEMKIMSLIQAKEYAIQFYKTHFWGPLSGDDLADGLDVVLFDCGVNQGMPLALRLKRINVEKGWDWKDLLLLRFKEYSRLPTWETFSLGWLRRILSLHRYVLSHYGKLD